MYDKIFYVGSKYSKDPGLYGSFGPTEAMFTTFSNSLHRQRRSALNPLFSQKAVHDLEWLIQDHIDVLCQRISSLKENNLPDLDLHHALRCVSIDVITQYAFGKSYDLLKKDDFGKGLFFKMIRTLASGIWMFRHFPILVVLIQKMPMWLAEKVDEAAGATARLQYVWACLVLLQDDANMCQTC